jgi:hypothetical protein
MKSALQFSFFCLLLFNLSADAKTHVNHFVRLAELLHINVDDPNEDIRTNVILNMEGI